MAADKDAFANDSLAKQVVPVKKAVKAFPPRTWFEWMLGISSKGSLALLRRALKDDIDIFDIVDLGGMSQEDFINAFVITNIFRPTNQGKFSLQFDVTRLAVKAVVADKRLGLFN